MAPSPDSGLAGAPQRSIFSQEGGGGTLPSWAAYGAFVGSLVFCAAVLAALGWFTIALMLVFGALFSVLLVLGFAPIAWGKPVPVNPGNFRNPKRGMMITAAAGPLSNLVQAVLFALVPILWVTIVVNMAVTASLAAIGAGIYGSLSLAIPARSKMPSWRYSGW